MKFLPLWVARIIGDKKFDQTVNRIVRLLEPAALKAIAVHSPGMSAFEARGYIRARSSIMVSRQVSAEIQSGVAVKHRGRLIEAVRESLIKTLLPQVAPARVETLPMRTRTAVRRAA